MNLTSLLKINQKIKIIFTSSCQIYGNQKGISIMNEDKLPNPETSYGISKLIAEIYLNQSAQAGLLRGDKVKLVSNNNGDLESPVITQMGIYHQIIKKGGSNANGWFVITKSVPSSAFNEKSLLYTDKNQDKNNISSALTYTENSLNIGEIYLSQDTWDGITVGEIIKISELFI